MRGFRVLRVIAKLLIPFILIFGLYVQFHGDYGPGGGFQAGVIVAAAVIFHALIYGLPHTQRVLPEWVVETMLAVGVLLYTGVGVVAMILARTAESAIVNDGLGLGGLGLALFGVYGFVAGPRMRLDETQALVRAQQALGFPVGHATTLRFTRALCSTSTSMASSMTASRRTPAIWAMVGGSCGVSGGVSRSSGTRTPTASTRSAPRLMAGLSGVVLRMQPSPKCRPSISTDGKKMGMALEAMTWATVIGSRDPMRWARSQRSKLSSSRLWTQVTERPVT